MHSIAFVLLCLLTFTIPWEAMFVFPWVGTFCRSIGLAAAAVSLFAVIINGGPRRLLAIHGVMAVYFGWAVLTLFWSKEGEASLTAVFTLGQLVAMAWLIWEFAPSYSRQRWLTYSFILGGTVGIFTQYLQGAAITNQRVAGGNLNENYFAALLVVTMCFAAFLAADRTVNKLFRMAFWAYCPICGIGVLLTGSRSGLLALLATIPVILVFQMRIRVLYVIAFLIPTIIVAVYARELIPERVAARLAGTTTDLQEGTFGTRMEIWKQSVALFADHPLEGSGCGASPYAMEKKFGIFVAAHDTWLSVLLDLGGIGLTLFIIMIVIAVRYVWRMPKRYRLLWSTVLISMAVIFVANMFETSKLLWFLLGLLPAQYAVGCAETAARRQNAALNRRRTDSPPLVALPTKFSK